MSLTDGYGGYESMVDAPEDVRDEVRRRATQDEHALCEPCAWDGRDTEVCLRADLHPEERLCGGDVELAVAVDRLPACRPCAVATVAFRILEALGLVIPGCDLCGAADGEHRRACPAGRS